MSARVSLKRHPSGCVGVIDIPHAGGAVRVTGVGSWFSDALSTAASVANRIASDPVMSAVLPPGAGLALKAVNVLSNAARSGGAPAVRQAAQQFTGPGAQRLARVLHAEAQARGVPEVLPAKHRAQMSRQRDEDGRADHVDPDSDADDSDDGGEE